MIRPDLLDSPLGRSLLRAGLDSVDGAFAFDAGDDIDKPGLANRRRTRLTLHDETGAAHVLFLKRYAAEPAGARLRRLWTYGPGGSPAHVEVRNIARVSGLGISTMQALAWGRQGGLLGARRSYLLVSAVPGEALSRIDPGPVCRQTDFARALTRSLADLARTLHAGGLTHRDFYACHIFVDGSGAAPSLSLIDLARVFAPKLSMRRWIVKDLAQLRYSMPEDWRAAWWRDFLGWYMPGKSARDYRRLHWAVEAKVAAIRRHAERRLERQWKAKDATPA